ncbi:MAG TPA: hypothetical protein VLF18_17095 [Tahibacter sp.]|uniref:hypothetical protein n=1 Tax=Tahibacter sp. TaxID=2056211 RepID=UPI002C49C0B2|nr:hypothetical protein [Tahibacter sp.]HSX61908.1 hypothetical protein [Tahibacter sp.]
MNNNFLVEKWNVILHWFRLQWNKPSSESALWRDSRSATRVKPAITPKKAPRRGTRLS